MSRENINDLYFSKKFFWYIITFLCINQNQNNSIPEKTISFAIVFSVFFILFIYFLTFHNPVDLDTFLAIRTAEVRTAKILRERDKIRENSPPGPGKSVLDFSPIASAIGI